MNLQHQIQPSVPSETRISGFDSIPGAEQNLLVTFATAATMGPVIYLAGLTSPIETATAITLTTMLFAWRYFSVDKPAQDQHVKEYYKELQLYGTHNQATIEKYKKIFDGNTDAIHNACCWRLT